MCRCHWRYRAKLCQCKHGFAVIVAGGFAAGISGSVNELALNKPGYIFTTPHFLSNLLSPNKLEQYITLCWKGLPGKTLTCLANL